MTKAEAMHKAETQYYEQAVRFPSMYNEIPIQLYIARNWRQIQLNAKEREKWNSAQ